MDLVKVSLTEKKYPKDKEQCQKPIWQSQDSTGWQVGVFSIFNKELYNRSEGYHAKDRAGRQHWALHTDGLIRRLCITLLQNSCGVWLIQFFLVCEKTELFETWQTNFLLDQFLLILQSSRLHQFKSFKDTTKNKWFQRVEGTLTQCLGGSILPMCWHWCIRGTCTQFPQMITLGSCHPHLQFQGHNAMQRCLTWDREAIAQGSSTKERPAPINNRVVSLSLLPVKVPAHFLPL